MRSRKWSLLLLPLAAMPYQLCAQEENARTFDGELTWQAVSTELESQALGVVTKILPKINVERALFSDSAFTLLGPDIEVRTGGSDAFDAVIAKLTGLTVLDPPLGEDGEANYGAFLHAFTYSLGFETTRNMNTPAALAEAGWIPIAPSKVGQDERFGLDGGRRVGVFLQLGYKFSADDPAAAPEGGAADESKESPDDAIARIKVDARYRLDLGERVVLIPIAQYWYDAKNGSSYYAISGTIRVAIQPGKYFWDIKFEKGAGAPTFNEGNQFSTGLTLAF